MLVNGWCAPSRNFERSAERDIKILSVGILLNERQTGGIKMIAHDKRYPTSEYAQRAHDVLLVSSFAIWAMVIGFAPVLTYRLLVS
jgi:hypothetical protein